MGLAKELITITTSIHSKWNICILLEKGQRNIYKYKYPINLDIVSNLLYFFCPHTHLEWGKKPYHTSQYQNALVNSKFTLRSYTFYFLYEIYTVFFFVTSTIYYVSTFFLYPFYIIPTGLANIKKCHKTKSGEIACQKVMEISFSCWSNIEKTEKCIHEKRKKFFLLIFIGFFYL